jgi:hypothetical protein
LFLWNQFNTTQITIIINLSYNFIQHLYLDSYPVYFGLHSFPARP